MNKKIVVSAALLFALTATAMTTTTTTIPAVYGQFGQPASSSSAMTNTTTAAPATPTTPQPPTTNIIMDGQTAARLAAQDPFFAQFQQLKKLCTDAYYYGNVTMSISQCVNTTQQATERWCGIQYFDALKCEYTTSMQIRFESIATNLYNLGFFDEIPSIYELYAGEPLPPLPPGIEPIPPPTQ